MSEYRAERRLVSSPLGWAMSGTVLSPASGCALALSCIDEIAQFLRQLPVPLTCLVRSELRRNRKKTLIISGNVALQQSDDVSCRRHKLLARMPGKVITPRIIGILDSAVLKNRMPYSS